MRFYKATSIGALVLLGLSGTAGDRAKKYGIPPAGWFRVLGKDGYRVGLDTTEKHKGKASAFVKSVPAKRSARAVGLEQPVQAGNYRGKRLRITAYLKTKDVERGAALYVRVDSKDKIGLSFDNMKDRRIKGTTHWKKYASVVDVLAEASTIKFGFFLVGKGQVWADDFKFEVVGKDVKVTQQAVEPAKRISPLPGEINKKLTNLDFEVLKNPRFEK